MRGRFALSLQWLRSCRQFCRLDLMKFLLWTYGRSVAELRDSRQPDEGKKGQTETLRRCVESEQVVSEQLEVWPTFWTVVSNIASHRPRPPGYPVTPSSSLVWRWCGMREL